MRNKLGCLWLLLTSAAWAARGIPYDVFPPYLVDRDGKRIWVTLSRTLTIMGPLSLALEANWRPCEGVTAGARKIGSALFKLLCPRAHGIVMRIELWNLKRMLRKAARQCGAPPELNELEFLSWYGEQMKRYEQHVK